VKISMIGLVMFTVGGLAIFTIRMSLAGPVDESRAFPVDAEGRILIPIITEELDGSMGRRICEADAIVLVKDGVIEEVRDTATRAPAPNEKVLSTASADVDLTGEHVVPVYRDEFGALHHGCAKQPYLATAP